MPSKLGDLKHNKIFIADCQCLLAAFLFGIGFLGQREISVDGLGPMTCNAFRFGVSTVLMLLALPLLPDDGPSEKTSDGDKEEHSDDEESGVRSNDKHENHSHSVTATPTHTKDKDSHNNNKSTIDNRFILYRICGLNFLSLKFAKKSVWFWGLTLGLLNFLGSGFQQVIIRFYMSLSIYI